MLSFRRGSSSSAPQALFHSGLSESRKSCLSHFEAWGWVRTGRRLHLADTRHAKVIVMQYCDGGDLRKAIKDKAKARAAFLVAQAHGGSFERHTEAVRSRSPECQEVASGSVWLLRPVTTLERTASGRRALLRGADHDLVRPIVLGASVPHAFREQQSQAFVSICGGACLILEGALVRLRSCGPLFWLPPQKPLSAVCKRGCESDPGCASV